MSDAAALANLPRHAARRLGQHYLDLGRQLLEQARRAEAAAIARAERRRRREHCDQVWQAVEGLRLLGLAREAALESAAARFGRTVEQIAASWAFADRRRGRHKKKLRDFDILRRARRGETQRAIAATVHLHPKSVGRILRRMIDRDVRLSP